MNEYVSRRELLVMLLAAEAGGQPIDKLKFIQKVIKLKVDDMETLFTGHEMFLPNTSFMAREAYRDLLTATRNELLKGRKRTATAKGQLEFILDRLANMFRHKNPFDNDNSFEEACHYIYASLKDYLQLNTRETRIWFIHPLGEEWVSDDKLTMVYTIMCLPGQVFDDKTKLFLMATALRPDVVTFNTFVDLTSPVVKSNELSDWMYRTQRLVPISEMSSRRNIRCIARQDKLAGLAKYLMSFTDARLREAEAVIETLPMAIGVTGSELKVWVGEMKKIDKNRKKMPVDVNSSRLDLLWLLANVTDPNKPEEGLAWMTDVWHHNADNEEAFLRGRFNAAGVKSKLINVREQIKNCTDPDTHTDANKFTNVISVLNGLFQNEKVVTDRVMGLQLIQLRNHLPYYLELGNNYVAEWNASLPTIVERSIKKELLMPNLVSYPTRRRMVAAVLFSKEIHDTTKAELLCVLASNDMLILAELLGWTQKFKSYDQYKIIQEQLTKSWEDTAEIEDDNILALARLMTEAHNLGHAPGLDGNHNLAKFLSLMSGYLGISQRMHDEFYNSNKENTMKHSIYLHTIDAVTGPHRAGKFSTAPLLALVRRVCEAHEEQLGSMEEFLVNAGYSPEFIKPYLAHLHAIESTGAQDNYRAEALCRIAHFFRSVRNQVGIDVNEFNKLVDQVQNTLKMTKAECMEWGMVYDSPDEPVKDYGFELPPSMQPTFVQQSHYRNGFDVSHEAIPYKAPNENLAQIIIQGFHADPSRALRTLVAMQEASAAMVLTDEQLAGAFSYLFRHGAVTAQLRIPKCEVELTPQDYVEYLVYWTTLIATQTQPSNSSQRLLNEDQIKTVFSYIDSLEKRQTLVRLI